LVLIKPLYNFLQELRGDFPAILCCGGKNIRYAYNQAGGKFGIGEICGGKCEKRRREVVGKKERK